MQRRSFLSTTCLMLALGSLTACSKKKPPSIPQGATVLAFGDSLTYGYGASINNSYPAFLAKITSWHVINAGVSGDTTVDALERLPELLKQHNPQLVLTGIGGNDMLRKMPVANTRANIISICQQITASGAQQMLIAMPQLSMVAASLGMLSDAPMYKAIATELNIALQENGWSQVLSDKNLHSDQIHANAKGYEMFANLLAQSLRKTGLLSS